MASFGKASQAKIDKLPARLQSVLYRAIKLYDFTVSQTVRTEEQHAQYLKDGTTTIPFNKSKHKPNELGLSEAFDIVPWPIDWEDLARFHYLAGIIRMCAEIEGVELKWGGDWNRNGDFKDQNFDDLPHFELVK